MPKTLSSDRSGRKSRSLSKKRKRNRRDVSESSDSTSVSSASSSTSSSSTNSSESDSKSRQRSKDKTSNQSRKRSSSTSSKKIKKRQQSASSSSSSSSCSPVRKKKKKKDIKKKKKKEKKKKRKKKKKNAETKVAAVSVLKESTVGVVKPNAVLSQPLQVDVKKKSEKSIGPLPRVMKPMTKEEWDKKQSVTRHVYDEETGRTRLIKGDGEVLEDIVTRDRHKEINKMSTEGDGRFFASKMGL